MYRHEMKKSLLIIFFFCHTSVYANSICNRDNAKIVELLSTPQSRMAFKNRGGLFNKGVCWWHSRLQRSSAYLVNYAPHLLPPTSAELKKILYHLMYMNKIVTIPGFHNFEDFSRTYEREIQRMLNYWQKVDGFFNHVWIQSISGHAQLHPDQLAQRMNNLFEVFNSSPQPLWVMAQIKGITSHSLLILRMRRSTHGYEWDVIDSNRQSETMTLHYQYGDIYLKAPGSSYSFIPYVGFQTDFNKILTAINLHCGQKSRLYLKDGEVEIPTHLQY